MQSYDYKTMTPIFSQYVKIMEKEAKINPQCQHYASRPAEIYKSANYLGEIAESSTVLRSWCPTFSLTSNQKIAYESDGAHTNLVMAMVDRALTSTYNQDRERYYGYTYREIMEAIRLHDLPENAFGDWPDNGTRDEAAKQRLENDFYDKFEQHYLPNETAFINHVRCLLRQMNDKATCYTAGQLLYTADKASVIIAALTYEVKRKEILATPAANEIPVGTPMMSESYPHASARDHAEMSLCDRREFGCYCKASEMFTADFLHLRQLNQYDVTGFFTAIVVMYTLMTYGSWYTWREKDYQAFNSLTDDHP